MEWSNRQGRYVPTGNDTQQEVDEYNHSIDLEEERKFIDEKMENEKEFSRQDRDDQQDCDEWDPYN